MMEIVSTILELVIAVAGLLISFLEIKKDRKETKRLEKLRDTEKSIISLVMDNNLKQSVENFGVTLKRVESDLSKVQELEGRITTLINDYSEMQNKIYKVYRQLLKDEAQFSLSYGFERYINAFRRFISTKQIVEEAKQKAEDLERINKGMFSDEANPDTRNSMFKAVEHLIEIMNENPELSVDDVCNYRINLLKTQVEGYSRNYNVYEAGVYNYFEYYYPVRKTIDLLRIELQELLPLIEELRIKYEE